METKKRHLASFDLSPDARRLLKEMAKADGVTMTAWLEFSIRSTHRDRTTDKWVVFSKINENYKEIPTDGA